MEYFLRLKGKLRNFLNKVFENVIQMYAHIDSSFVTWFTLNDLTCQQRIFGLNKNGKGVISLKVLSVYIGKKLVPQYLFSKSGKTHLSYSLTLLAMTFKLQKEFLKTELNQD